MEHPVQGFQLDLTPEVEVFHMLFEICHTKNRKRSIKQHIKYFNFWSLVLLDLPVHIILSGLRERCLTERRPASGT